MTSDFEELSKTTVCCQLPVVFMPLTTGGFTGRLIAKGADVTATGETLDEVRWRLEYAVRNYLTVCLMTGRFMPQPHVGALNFEEFDGCMLPGLPLRHLVIEVLNISSPSTLTVRMPHLPAQ